MMSGLDPSHYRSREAYEYALMKYRDYIRGMKDRVNPDYSYDSYHKALNGNYGISAILKEQEDNAKNKQNKLILLLT